jgi:hypothetical protein
MIEDEGHDFLGFVERNRLAHEEGSLFSYLARVMKTARRIAEATEVPQFAEIDQRIRTYLGAVDPRMLEDS